MVTRQDESTLHHLLDAKKENADNQNKINLFVICTIPFLCMMLLFAIQETTNVSIICQSAVKLAIIISAGVGAITYMLPDYLRLVFIIILALAFLNIMTY